LRGEALPALPAVTEHGRETRVTAARFSLLQSRRRARLFDLVADPGERENVAREAPAEVAALEAALAAHESRPRDAGGSAAERTLDAQTRRELQALGYLGGEREVTPPRPPPPPRR
jgi:hypothetical protein